MILKNIHLTKIKEQSYFVFFSFLFSPSISLLIALKNFRFSWSKNVVWAFIIFYAYHFSAPNEGADILAYIDKFKAFINRDFSLFEFIAFNYSKESTTLDIFEPILSYLISKITNNHHFLLMMYGVVFGFFYSRNIWFLINITTGNLKFRAFVVLFLLVTQIGIWDLNGFRFWCAAQMFFYSIFCLFIFNKNFKAYTFLILTCLTHLGLLVPVIIILIFRFIKFPFLFLILFFFSTFFLAELDIAGFRKIINIYAPDFVIGKLNTYTSEGYVKAVTKQYMSYSLFFKFSKIFRSILILFFTTLIIFNKRLFEKKIMWNLFSFFLLLGGVANILSNLPSGGRYIIISDFLLFGIVFYYFQFFSTFKYVILFYLITPLVLIYGFYNFRIIGIHTFNIHHIINNPITSLFIY